MEKNRVLLFFLFILILFIVSTASAQDLSEVEGPSSEAVDFYHNIWLTIDDLLGPDLTLSEEELAWMNRNSERPAALFSHGEADNFIETDESMALPLQEDEPGLLSDPEAEPAGWITVAVVTFSDDEVPDESADDIWFSYSRE